MEQNTGKVTPRNLMTNQLPQNQERPNKTTNIFDDGFIFLINNLSDSIKEFYKVSKYNFSETSTFISYCEEEGQSMSLLIKEILNNNQFERISEIIEKIGKINAIISQLHNNSNSSNQNLNLFFQDAKTLFKQMKMKRKENLIEMNKNNISNISQLTNEGNNDSISLINNNKNINLIKNEYNQNSFNAINKAYSQIVILLNKFSQFNNIIGEINIGASNNFSILRNNIKKELDSMMNLVKNFYQNNKSMITKLYSNNSNNALNEEQKKRSKSQTNNNYKEIEKLKLRIQISDNKIKELTNQLNTYRKINNNNLRSSKETYETEPNRIEFDLNNNNNLKIMKLEQMIKEKDNIIMNLKNKGINSIYNNNLNANMNNFMNQKDNQLLNLQKQLNIYQQKINQYDYKISFLNGKITSLSNIIVNKNKEILKLQNDNTKINSKKNISKINMQDLDRNSLDEKDEIIKGLKNENEIYKNMVEQYENQIIGLTYSGMNNNMNMNINSPNENNPMLQKRIEVLNKDIQILNNKNKMYEQKINALNIKNSKTYKIIEEQKVVINQLNKEIMNYKRMEKINEESNNKYIKQIEEMNNNILSTNKIIEQKDQLIKQLNERKDLINNNAPNNQTNIEFNMNLNEINQLKMENEQLKIQIEEFKLNQNNNFINNNNLLLREKIINGNDLKELQELNIQLMEENNDIQSQNAELLDKIKQLTLQNNQMQESIKSLKENISKLESEIKKKNEESEGLKTFILKLQTQLENKEDSLARERRRKDEPVKQLTSNSIGKKGIGEDLEGAPCSSIRVNSAKRNNGNLDKSFDAKDMNTDKIKNLLNRINDNERQIYTLQNKNKELQNMNKELQFKLEDKQVEKELSGFRTEDANFSNYEEEFDLKKMVNGARDKNRSEDINIDYPGVQGIKDKYKELQQNFNMLEEQVKILISNISCSSKIKPQITQICQLMRIPAKNIQLIIAGKDKKRALGIME